MSLTTLPPLPPDTQPEPIPQSSRPSIRSLWATYRSWSSRILSLREDQLFMFLAVLIGIFSGLAVVCFRIAIEWVHLVPLGSSISPPVPRVLVVPSVGGLIVALLVFSFFPAGAGGGGKTR